MNASSTTEALTAHDRCDRCGAQASVRAEIQGIGDLLFCPHHARVHADKLHEVASVIQDDSGSMGALF